MPEEKTLRIFSLNPDTFITGGLLNDVDCMMKDFEFCVWDYNGKGKETVALKGTIVVDGAEEEHEQYWSVGSPELNQPVNNGNAVASDKGSSGFNKNSNCGLFLMSLKDCGLDVTKLDAGDITVLNGVKLHLLRKPTKGLREGMPERDTGSERKFDESVLCATTVYQWPWEKKPAVKKAAGKTAGPAAAAKAPAAAAKPAGKTAPATTEAAEPAAGGDIESLAIETLSTLIKERGGLEMGKIKLFVFQALGAQSVDVRKAVGELITNEDWLLINGFNTDGGTLTV